jgi:phospholipid transport system transporter-binding protein
VLALPQELTQSQAMVCLASLLKGMGEQPGLEVVLDATPLTRFDSAALAVLLDLRRQAVTLGKQLTIRGLPGRLSDLAALYGITELLQPA